MSPNSFKYMVQTPELYAGEVMGKLTVLGTTVSNVETRDGIWSITVESERDILNEFKPWLQIITNNSGVVNCLP